MKTLEKKRNLLFSHIKDKYKVFSMRNAKSRIFSRKKVGLRRSEGEKIKGVNVSLEDKFCSDSVVNSSDDHISSTSVSFSSDKTMSGSNNYTDGESQGSKCGRKLNNITALNIENTAAINSNTSFDKIDSNSNSNLPFNKTLSESSPTSLLSDSSSSLNSKYVSKNSSDIRISANEHLVLHNGICSTNHDSFRTSCEEKSSREQGALITKRIENVVKRKPCKRRNTDNNNYRENAIYLNKQILDILNSKNPNKEEKRTTQRIVAIENPGVNEKDVERNAIPCTANELYDQKANRYSLKESNIDLGWETPLIIPMTIESNCCYQSNYLNYDILIDYICINDNQCHLCSFTEALH
ncbi:uncharacterized protein ELE39_001182 [Cryptosporidium sp. chipmunk genotype I]|uniref:uncharacterized protein n=1 Tax=Cryptosporidium sp. chipmunk genotype I TaxID=1280935 RepID=UPI00351A45CE|nr:hypothetical protein ELE39_001182 [Cryptosporidium sp. chipmunk genotype I]